MTTRRELRALLRLARAHLASRSARLRFVDTGRRTAARTVSVVALSFDPPRWLVAAWSPEHGSLRLLDLARVVRIDASRRRAAPPPPGFDAEHFAQRAWLDPAAGPPGAVTLRLERPWDSVARALLPSAEAGATDRRGTCFRMWTSRPDLVGVLAASLAADGALDSSSPPCPPPPTRSASSSSPPGSSPRAAPSPARTPSRASRSTTRGSRTRRRRCSSATRTR